MNNAVRTFSLTLFYKTSSTSSKSLILLLVLCLFDMAAKAQSDVREKISSAQTSTFVFKYDESTIVKAGGFEGVHETYHIEGTLQLSVDFDSITALFSRVDANLLDENGLLYEKSLGEILNMTELIGTVVNDNKIEFVGQTSDGLESAIRLMLLLTGDTAHLTGQTIPTHNSADFFIYELKSTALKKYGGGTGDSNDPYLIYTPERMNAIGAEPNDGDKHFKLMDDIDLDGFTGTDFNIVGKGWAYPFTGVFDGNGKKILNFTYTSTDTDYIGLFRYISLIWGKDTIIKNLGLINPNVAAGKGRHVGILIGYLESDIRKSSLESETIIGCYVQGGSVSGGDRVGGLVGSNGGLIIRCYATNSVSGNDFVGGLVGYNEGAITNCYSAGKVKGKINVGGMAGNGSYGTVTASFWDIQTSDQTTSAGGEGKTTAEMKTMSTFTDAGWDFAGESVNGIEDIWSICEGTNYPRLTWQIPAGDFVCPDGINIEDFLFFIGHWRDDICDSDNGYCQGTDLDKSGTVDTADLEIFIENWLDNNTPANSDSVVEDNVEYYIQTNKHIYNLGENVRILYKVTNLGSEPVDLGYTVLGMFFCRFNIKDEDGNYVWKWPWITPLGPSMKFTLGPFGLQEFRINWNMINDNGTSGPDDGFSVGPGIYNIVGTLDMEPNEKRVSVSISVAIRDSDG